MKTFIALKKQDGISLLEVLLSLGIIAIILVMATKYFFVASRNNKVNTLRQQVGEVISGINMWKGQHPTYNDTGTDGKTGTLSIGTLSSEGFLANSSLMKSAGTKDATLNNPWGYAITITNITATGVDVKTTLPGQNECEALRNSYPDAKKCSGGDFTLHVPNETKGNA